MQENVVDWIEGDADVELKQYITNLMEIEDSETAKALNLQMIGSELGHQAGEDADPEELYGKILEADGTEDDLVFGISPERAEHAFYEMGYDAAIRRRNHGEE